MFYPEDLELAKERDTQEDVLKSQKALKSIHYYSFMGEEGKRIEKILRGLEPQNEMEALERWEAYLEQHLSFPFEVIVDAWQEKGPLDKGDKVSVKKISLIDDLYGIIVELIFGRKKYDYPLCELAAIDKKSLNYQLIQDYRVWF